MRSILGPDFSKHSPPKECAESSFTDLIEQMKTDKQPPDPEPTFEDLINQMKSEKQSQASSPASESESSTDDGEEPDTTAVKDEAQPEEEPGKQATDEALMQQLVQHLEEARASGMISEELYNAMTPVDGAS